MKNKQVERRRRLAKQYHQNKRGTPFVDGIMVWLQYEHIMESALSWWDGVEFVLGGHAYLSVLATSASCIS